MDNSLNNIESLKKYKHIHMIGIGGISMSGIAEILHNWGFFVTGSDCTRTKITDRLSSHGIFVHIGHSTNLVEGSDLIIYSAAVKSDDPEFLAAKKLNIQIIERSDFVGYLTRIFSNTIGIAGTHGKTTTTSMVSLIFIEAGLDPTVQVGGMLKPINGNYRIGNGDTFILEACEYVESFLKFSPKSSIVLNIDNDHLDYFQNFDNIKKAFEKYVYILPGDGILVVNGDDQSCLDLRSHSIAKFVTFGINNEKCNFVARNISFDINGYPKFDVYYNNNFFFELKLSIVGRHNILNALACIALCTEYKISKYIIKDTLSAFAGVNRRFELIGSYDNILLYDDYAHHPSEISATADALKNKKHRQSWVVFQPHTYSRTKLLLDDFAKSLSKFDNIIITDIYAAREKDTKDISSQDLVNKINLFNKTALYIKDFDDIVKHIKEHACPNDIVISIGAGTVGEVVRKLLN